MSLTLYHGDPAGPSPTVLAPLFESGVDADLRRIDLGQALVDERREAGCAVVAVAVALAEPEP